MSTLELSNAQCFSSLLSRLGIGIPGQRLLELGGGTISARFISRTLRSRGEAARSVTVESRDLACIELPTLLTLRSGELCILCHVRGRRAEIERGNGQLETLPLEELAANVATAIERAPRLDEGGTFWNALTTILSHRAFALLWLLVVGIGLMGLSLLSPWLTRQAMSEALGEHAPSLLMTLVAALVATSCMRAWLSWLRARARLSIEVDLVCATARMMFRRINALPYAEHQQRGFGDLLQALGSAEALSRLLAKLGISPVLDGLLAFAYWVVITASSSRVGAGLLALALLAVLGTLALARRYARFQSQEIRESARSRARLHELIQGIATIKAEHAERTGITRWLETLLAERGVALSRELTECWLSVWLMSIERVGRLGVLGWAAFEVVDLRLSVAELIYLGMMAEGFLLAVTSLCRVGVSLVSARRHLERVDALLAVEPSPASLRLTSTKRTQAAEGSGVELSDVWFRYGPEQPWILKGYNLKLAPGEQFVLRGSSGAGKTTILRLIAGFYRPERGTVSVMGRDPWQDRSAIAYLPQHATLLSGSLRDNLLHLSGVSLERVVAACEATGLLRWLRTLPMGIETTVSPGGASLSGGQRQWIVLTAAVASERPIVLMDESTSQLDHLLRAGLTQQRLFANRTTITVSHDT